MGTKIWVNIGFGNGLLHDGTETNANLSSLKQDRKFYFWNRIQVPKVPTT